MSQQGTPPNYNPYNQPPQGTQQQQYPGAPQQQYAGAPQQQYAGAPQQQYPGAPQQNYPGGPQQQYPGMAQPYPGMPQAGQAAPKRNPALIAVGGICLLISLGVGILFMMNLHQYLTIEDKWANDPRLIPEARAFGTALIKGAAMKRMTMFGPISGIFGLVGLVLIILGVRKK